MNLLIRGIFSGAASTHFQVLSTESQKYFQRAILMSGSVWNYWALSQTNNHTEYAFEMAESWNKPQENVTDLIRLLRTVPPTNFIESSKVIKNLQLTFELQFNPVVEGMNKMHSMGRNIFFKSHLFYFHDLLRPKCRWAMQFRML